MSVTEEQPHQQQQQQSYIQFINSIHSEATKTGYIRFLNDFVSFTKLDYDSIVELETKKIQALIISYIIYMKKEIHLSPASMKAKTAALKAFLDMNDCLSINWKKVKKYMGESYTVVDDRAYTREEIQTLVNAAHSLRDKAIILLLASTGMRRGAVPELKLVHLRKIDEYHIYAIDVYKHAREQYYTFCTPEARKAIDDYIAWRSRLGEKITAESTLFRETFDVQFGARSSNNIKPLGPTTIKYMLRLLRNQTGIVEKQHLTENVRRGSQRTQIANSHGFRKFAITQMIKAKVDYNTREFIVGHKTSRGLDKNYDRTTEEDRLEEYLKAVDLLTINEENRLKIKLVKLEEENSDIQNDINRIKKKLGLPPS